MFPKLFWIFWTYTQAWGHSTDNITTLILFCWRTCFPQCCVFVFWTTVFQSRWTTLRPSTVCKGSRSFAFMSVSVILMGVEWWLRGFSCGLLQTAQMNVLYVPASIYPSPFGELSNSLVGSGDVPPSHMLPCHCVFPLLCISFKIFFCCQCISYLPSPRSHSNPVLKLSILCPYTS